MKRLAIIALFALNFAGYVLAAPAGDGGNQLNDQQTEYDLRSLDSDAAKKESFCNANDNVPSASMIASLAEYNTYVTLNADDSNSPTEEEMEQLDLSVLTHNMQCFRDACDGNSDAQNNPITFGSCLDKLEMQQKNVFQFRPENYVQQLEKACSCGYDGDQYDRLSVGEGNDKVSVCDAYLVHNQPITGSPNMNAFRMLKNRGFCEDTSNIRLANQTEEKMEYFRVEKLCEAGMIALIDGEQIVPPRCEELFVMQTRLRAACSVECFFYPRYESISFDKNWDQLDESDPFYQFSSDFPAQCGGFEAPDGKTYTSQSVDFVGNQRIWNDVVDLCEEFRAGGSEDIPERLQFTPVTRNINPVSKVKAAFETCCKAQSEYEGVEKEEASIWGKAESDCMYNEGVVVDFGFLPSLVRGAITMSTSKCWELYSTLSTCTLKPRPEGAECSGAPTADEQMQLKEGRMHPREIFWFLKYEQDPVRLAVSLKACAAGAKIGRTVTVLPGITLSLEAQEYAMTTNVPENYKMHALLAHHMCAVHASVHSNSYFEPAAPEDEPQNCNQYALKWDAERVESC